MKTDVRILLKNAENLIQKQVPRLQEILDANENLFKVYVLKDDLKAIWVHRDRAEMTVAPKRLVFAGSGGQLEAAKSLCRDDHQARRWHRPLRTLDPCWMPIGHE